MNPSSRKKTLRLAMFGGIAIAAIIGTQGKAVSAGGDATELKERCATRMAITFYGESADPTLLANADPQSQIDTMLASPKFIERFARFTNASMNNGPGATAVQDSAYYLSKYILEKGRPWKDVFTGPFKVAVAPGDKTNTPVVIDDPSGVGYFRSDAWLHRYAGNESAGIKLSSAYRILQNLTGLELVASTNAPGADVTATGRKAAACSGCHYDNWYALDKIASVLSLRVGQGDTQTFTPNTNGPQQLLDTTISDDKQLIETLVNSDSFRFRTCRIAFKFLYGRTENKCETELFDKCMTEFQTKGTIQSAIAVIAKDTSYCQ